MKKIIVLISALLWTFGTSLQAQKKDIPAASKPVIVYETRIYTDPSLGDELLDLRNTRGFGSDLLTSLANAAIGAASGCVSTIVDLGVQALGKLITLDRRNKQEWLENAQKECRYTDSIGTLYALNDFYSTGSKLGTLDPTGIQFNGIGCLAKIGEDTAFYISCHLNRDKLNRLLDHSKFEMVLDSVIINPYRSHLPNTSLPIRFSFAQRKSFNFKMTIQIISSWMDFTPSLHQNQVLGEFVLSIPIDSAAIEKSPNGTLVYVCQPGQEAPYQLVGESFIVPRSYMELVDENQQLVQHYGTGQYSVNVIIEETCELTPEYQKAWRKDRKMRKAMAKKTNKKVTFDDVCRMVTNQTWDETLKSWVVTLVKAPADYSIKALNEKLKLPTTGQQQSQK